MLYLKLLVEKRQMSKPKQGMLQMLMHTINNEKVK